MSVPTRSVPVVLSSSSRAWSVTRLLARLARCLDCRHVCKTDRAGQASRHRPPQCTEARGPAQFACIHLSRGPERVARIAWARQVDHAAHADLPTERQTAADGGNLVQQRDDVLIDVRTRSSRCTCRGGVGVVSSLHHVWSNSSEQGQEQPSREGVDSVEVKIGNRGMLSYYLSYRRG